MPGRRTTGCALIGLLVLAACASSPTADPPPGTAPVASELDEPTGDTDPEATRSDVQPEDTPTSIESSDVPAAGGAPSTTAPCDRRVVLDEYGFPVEFELCDDGDGTADVSPPAVLARVPSVAARTALDAGHQAAQRIAAACGNAAAWAFEVERSAAGFASMTETIRNDAELTDWFGGPDSRTLADEFRDLLVLPEGCARDGAAPPAGDATDDALAAAGKIAGINDDIRFALVAPDQILFDSDFWYATDQIGHLADSALILETEPIDVLLLGASTVKRGIDPVQLSDATGRMVYNAAVGALSPDLQLGWYRELRASGVQPETVVIGLNTWIEFLPCESPQKDRVEATDARRDEAFRSIDELAGFPPGERLTGGDPPSYEGRALEDHRATWVPGTGGRLELSDEYQQQIADTQAETYRSLPYDGLCSDRLDRIAELANEIVDDGSAVVFVVLPTSETVAEFHPDGRAGHDMVLEEYRSIAASTGAQLVDVSHLVDEELYVDLTHVGNAGRAMITDALVTAIVAS